MGEVTSLYPGQDPDHVLTEAIGEYQDCLIIGKTKEGNMRIGCTSNINMKDVLWMVEYLKQEIIFNLDED